MALTKMKFGKASGPSGVTSELLKASGNTGVKELTRVFQDIVRTEEIPADWRQSITIPIYRVTISCLFLRFVLIFKGNVLQNMNVLISKKRAYF